VPGILVSQSITGKVKFDEGKPDGLSGKVKTPKGWDDTEITLGLDLLTDEESTCYDKLGEINALFRGADNGGNPKVYEIVNVHALARGLQKVIFSGLQSSEKDDDDVIGVSLTFVEHNPPVVHREKRVARAKQAKGGSDAAGQKGSTDTPGTNAPEPAADEKVTVDVEEPPAATRQTRDGLAGMDAELDAELAQ
jgi:hypothetical protein